MTQRTKALGVLITCMALLCGCDMFVSADVRVERAQQLMAAHDYRAAMIELKNALQSQEDHAEARLLLASVSLQLGDVAAADKELRRAGAAGAPAERMAPLQAEIDLALGKARELLAALVSGALQLPEPQRSTYRGLALLAVREPEQALAAFQNALAVDAHNQKARLGLAQTRLAQGRIDDAFREIDAVIAEDPAAAEALLARGTLRSHRGEFEQAEKDLRAAQQHAPARLTARQQAALLSALGEVQLARIDTKAARETLAQLAALTPDAPITLVLSARISIAEQDYSKAATDLQKVIVAAPDFVAARFLLGAVLLAQGNLRQAELHLSQALQRAPENLEARKLLAQVQLRLERPDEAMQVLLPAVESDAFDAQAGALLGAANQQLGTQTKGLELLERSVAHNPGNRGLKIELATAYWRSGSNTQAIQLMRTLEHVAGDARRERLLITAIASQDGIAAAREEVDRMVTAWPQESEVLSLAGSFFAAQGEFERARTLLGRASQAAPSDAAVLINRARVEMAAGDINAGAAWLEKSLQVDPKNLQARMLLAELAVRRNDAVAATRWLEEARKVDKDALEPRLQLARVHLRARRNQQADEVIKEVLATAGGRAEVVNAVGLIDLEAGRHHEALARFRAAAQLTPGEPSYELNAARAQLALGQAAVARESLQRCLELRANWIPAVGTLALIDVSEGKAADAFARIAALKRAAPREPAVPMLEGDVHMALKQYAEAAQAFDAALALQPTAQAAMKSYRARQLGKLGDSAKPLEAWLKRKPDDFAARAALAEAYRLAGQRSRAIAEYELLISKGPLNVGALNNLAWLYHEERDDRAASIASRAYAVAPNIPAVADTYGWILLQSGRAREALPVLQQAAAGAQGHPEIGYHYAAALAATGAAAEARKLLKRVLDHPEPFASRADAERLLERLPQS